MNKTRLVFGNLDHIALAERGTMCKCGHSKSHHFGVCTAETEEKKWCTCDCGDVHLVQAECDCEEFKLDNNLKLK